MNGEFEHKNYKIKVPVLKKKSQKSIGGPQGSQHFVERKQNIDIQVIRIMKRRKEVGHS